MTRLSAGAQHVSPNPAERRDALTAELSGLEEAERRSDAVFTALAASASGRQQKCSDTGLMRSQEDRWNLHSADKLSGERFKTKQNQASKHKGNQQKDRWDSTPHFSFLRLGCVSSSPLLLLSSSLGTEISCRWIASCSGFRSDSAALLSAVGLEPRFLCPRESSWVPEPRTRSHPGEDLRLLSACWSRF